MIGNSIHFLHSIEKDSPDLKERSIYLVENAAMVSKLALLIHKFPDDAKAHKADMRLALGDVMVQAALMCLDLGFHPSEIYKLGIAHVKERLQERGIA
ncbi:MAG: hypothetical protein ABR985_21695 [Methanotrichaceae archaeon]|jgi:hypothetical protein